MPDNPDIPHRPVTMDILWGPDCLGGPALAVVDLLRTITTLAAMRNPRAAAPVAWRWIGVPRAQRPGGAARGDSFRGTADIVVLPGWHADSGPDLDRLVLASEPLVAGLRSVATAGGRLAGIFNASGLLARAGLLHGRQAASPWTFMASVLRQDESVRFVSDRPWVQDGPVWTCDSPAYATEMVLDMLRQTPLAHLALAAAHIYLHSEERQQVGARIVHGVHQQTLPAGALERAKRWLENHTVEPYDLGATARAAATSPRSLLRHFAVALGQSPLDYLHGLRVARAQVLLETTYTSVEEVARSCGYQDLGTFRRIFLRVTGELPAAYREHYRLRTSRKRWRGAATGNPP
jgi:transcriptional regulator GlxA family with amidase domain